MVDYLHIISTCSEFGELDDSGKELRNGEENNQDLESFNFEFSI